MVHRRSRAAREKRLARRVVQDYAWLDREVGERINLLSSDQISCLTQQRSSWEGQSVHVGRDYDRGEVLTDSLGRGTLQRVSVPKSLERQLKAMQLLKEERRLARFERSQAVDEPVLVEVFQPKRRICGNCGAKISRICKSGFCWHCYQGEMKKLREQKSPGTT